MLAQRADRADRQPTFSRRDLVRLLGVSAVLILVLTAIFAIDIVPTRIDVQVGEVAGADILAPRTISFASASRTAAARDAKSAAVEPQYDFTIDKATAVARQQEQAFEQAVVPVDNAFDPATSESDRIALLDAALPGLSDEARATLMALPLGRWKAIRDESSRVLDQLETSELRDADLAEVRDRLPGRILGGLNEAERKLAAEIVAPLLVANSDFDQGATDTARRVAADGVAPVIVSLSQGQAIVRKGDPITTDVKEAVDAFGLGTASWDLAKLAGWALFSTLLVGVLLAWLWRYRPELWHRTNVLALVGLMLVLSTFALEVTAGRAAMPYIVPTAAVGILGALLLDAATAMVLMSVIAVVAGAVNGTLEMTTYVFFGGVAGIVAVRRGDRLNVFVQAAVAIALVDTLVVTTFGLLGQRDLTGVLQLWGASAAAGVGAAVLAVGTFAVIGNIFGITTAFQLLELANPSQPLLRRLLLETPGTYHHSIMVANLAERAAESIGADPLLTRVAAYYHDVGKLANPLAFIENQAGGDNVHDELDPETSAQILKAHVADGIEIAYQARLPKPIIAFIPQHHGTALMSYFYAKARELAAAPYGGLSTAEGEKAADAIDEARYRHAGPKPQSREAALIMLADGIEASVRSLSSRDEPAIRAMVSRIIEERLQDGQFDECDLTLRDVEHIREAFVTQLLGMYHQRIAYPQSKIVELEARRAAVAGGGGAGGAGGGAAGAAPGVGPATRGGVLDGPSGPPGPDAG